jgi:small subunit ribosomal protein S2
MVGIIEEIKDAFEDDETQEEAVEKKSSKSEKGKKNPKNSLKSAAEAESTVEEKVNELEEKKKALLKKAEKLKEKLEKPTTEELKEKVKLKKREDMLIPLEEYVKSGIYLGTRVVTPNMKPFVYRRRADGLAIFNTDTIDEKLKEGIAYLSNFAPEDVILVCKRPAGWKAAEKFAEATGIRVFTKKYPAGVLTNKTLPNFFENELTIIVDQWVDKNALNDTLKVRKKVLMVCDTNNFSQGSNQVIIGNNKSPKSLGVIFYLLAQGYCKARGIQANIPDLEWWTGEEEETRRGSSIKREKVEAAAQFGV